MILFLSFVARYPKYSRLLNPFLLNKDYTGGLDKIAELDKSVEDHSHAIRLAIYKSMFLRLKGDYQEALNSARNAKFNSFQIRSAFLQARALVVESEILNDKGDVSIAIETIGQAKNCLSSFSQKTKEQDNLSKKISRIEKLLITSVG